MKTYAEMSDLYKNNDVYTSNRINPKFENFLSAAFGKRHDCESAALSILN